MTHCSLCHGSPMFFYSKRFFLSHLFLQTSGGWGYIGGKKHNRNTTLKRIPSNRSWKTPTENGQLLLIGLADWLIAWLVSFHWSGQDTACIDVGLSIEFPDWMVWWLIDWLVDCRGNGSVWVAGWWTDWLIDWWIGETVWYMWWRNWLIWLIDSLLHVVNIFIDWCHKLIDVTNWLINWLIALIWYNIICSRLMNWPIDDLAPVDAFICGILVSNRCNWGLI